MAKSKMLKAKDVYEAAGAAISNIKRTKRMADMKYPLLDKRGYTIRFYFTNATGGYYQSIIEAFMKRKRNIKVEADKLYCFEYNHKEDGWFVEDIKELTDFIEDRFDKYFKKYVEPQIKKEGKK